jgi:hypothetical protein
MISTQPWGTRHPGSVNGNTVVATALRSRPLDSRGALQGAVYEVHGQDGYSSPVVHANRGRQVFGDTADGIILRRTTREDVA